MWRREAVDQVQYPLHNRLIGCAITILEESPYLRVLPRIEPNAISGTSIGEPSFTVEVGAI
jgi:hypothetical protein